MIKDENPLTSNSILVQRSNFSWGGQKEDKPGDKKEEKKKSSIEKTSPKKKKKEYTAINDDIESETNSSRASLVSDDESKEEEKKKQPKVDETIILQNLQLTVGKGEFVCIIGEVGSGKSSLISALLGDMIHLGPETLDNLKNKELTPEVLEEMIRLSKE